MYEFSILGKFPCAFDGTHRSFLAFSVRPGFSDLVEVPANLAASAEVKNLRSLEARHLCSDEIWI